MRLAPVQLISFSATMAGASRSGGSAMGPETAPTAVTSSKLCAQTKLVPIRSLTAATQRTSASQETGIVTE